MFLLQQVLTAHHELIKSFGGPIGVRDLDSLQSALNRPFQTFGEIEFYSSPELKASAIIQGLIINDPFIDHNKRVAKGKLNIEEISNWFTQHIVKV